MFTFRAAERRPRKRLLFLLDKGAHAGHKARAVRERSGSLTSEERVGKRTLSSLKGKEFPFWIKLYLTGEFDSGSD